MERLLLQKLPFFLCFGLVFTQSHSYAQPPCDYDNSYHADITLAGGITGTADCIHMGEYAIVDVEQGETYDFSTCGSSKDLAMTLYESTGTTALSSDDDGCGMLAGPSFISWTATFTGPVHILIDKYPCQDGGNACIPLSVTCTSCAGATTPGGGLCGEMAPICTNYGLAFPAGTDEADAEFSDPNNNYGCLDVNQLGSSPNPAWYYLEIDDSGDLLMSLTAMYDIDYAIWGPYADLNTAQAACGSLPAPIDCSYDPTNLEFPEILGAQMGEVYVMLITNFSNNTQNVSLQQTGGTASTNCNIVSCNMTALGGVTDALCGSLGAIDVSVSGGTLPYTYSWSIGEVTEDLSDLAAGTYDLTITDDNGCEEFMSFTVNASATLDINSTIKNLNCYQVEEGFIDLSVSGGTLPYTYSWSTGEVTEDLSDLAAGTYEVTVLDNNSCSAIANFILTQPLQMDVNLDVITDATCAFPGAAEINVSGGSPGYTYLWSNGSTVEDPVDLPAGLYAVTVTDANNCTAVLNDIYVDNPSGVSIDLEVIDVSCNGLSDGHINSTLLTGASPIDYSWGNGAQTEGLNNISSGVYDLTVTDANACTATYSSLVDQPAAFDLSNTTIPIACYGEDNGELTIQISGGVAPYDLLWNTGAIETDVLMGTISGLSSGDYQLTITDDIGCSITSNSFTFIEPSELLIELDALNDPNCLGDNGTIDVDIVGGTVPYTYAWNTGSTDEDIVGLSSGDYILTVTDANGCSISTNTWTLNAAEPLLVSIFKSIGMTACDGTADGELVAIVSGGSGDYFFEWSNASIDSVNTNLEAGLYNLTVTDLIGCTATATESIEAPIIPNIEAYINIQGTTDLETIENSFTLSGGNDQTALGVNYEWTELNYSTNVTIADAFAFSTMVETNSDGVYSFELFAQSIDGCIAIDTLTVTVYDDNFDIPTAFTPDADGLNDLFRPMGLDFETIRDFRIYNRWGQLVYDDGQLSEGGWNGKYLDIDQPKDIYVYILEYQRRTDPEPVLMRGEVNLLR